MDSRRSERLSGAIREELEEILNYELEDPRVGAISVTEVIVTPNGRRAVVRVSPNGDPEEQRSAMDALSGARRHIRQMLAERLDLYRTPDIEFEAALDPQSTQKARHLLRRVRKGRPRD